MTAPTDPASDPRAALSATLGTTRGASRTWALAMVGVAGIAAGVAAQRFDERVAPAWAGQPSTAPRVEGRALADARAPTLQAGLGRLEAMLVRRAVAADLGDERVALAEALAAEGMEPLQAAYGDQPTHQLVGEEGLTSEGATAWRWVSRAALLDVSGTDDPVGRVDPEAASAWQAAAAAYTRGAAEDGADGAGAMPALERGALEEAWRASAGEDDRLKAAAEVLRSRVAALRARRDERTAALAVRARARAGLEAQLAALLVDAAAALTARPNPHVVLSDDKGRYRSPDVLWQEAEPTDRAALAGEVLASVRERTLEASMAARLPPGSQLPALLDAAERYRALCDAGGFPALPRPRARRYTGWKNAEAVAQLQARLALEGYWVGEPTGVFDETLKAQLKRYQAAHHLKTRGSYGAETHWALSVPCEERLRVLQANAKRWRHTAMTGQTTYVHANLAAQEVRYVRDGEARATHRTVVGSGGWFWDADTEERVYPKASPVLRDAISAVVVNPTWTVPGGIVARELRPKYERDPQFLDEGGYAIVNSGGREIWKQLPGPKNVLGDVKLLFPNAEAIYMHDTNQRGLFRRPVRDFSHGCVRVHEAVEFATAILKDDWALKGERLNDSRLHRIAGREDHKTFWFRLEREVPVFLEYYTASVTDDGTVRFHPDVYEYDRRLFEGPLRRSRKGEPAWRAFYKPKRRQKR